MNLNIQFKIHFPHGKKQGCTQRWECRVTLDPQKSKISVHYFTFLVIIVLILIYCSINIDKPTQKYNPIKITILYIKRKHILMLQQLWSNHITDIFLYNNLFCYRYSKAKVLEWVHNFVNQLFNTTLSLNSHGLFSCHLCLGSPQNQTLFNQLPAPSLFLASLHHHIQTSELWDSPG